MNSEKKDREPWPLCGYGRLGLCCSSCLLGPCRLNPFDEAPDRARCGRDADLLVAHNLHRMAALEAAEAIRNLGTYSPERLKSLFPEGPFPHLSEFGIPPQSLLPFFFKQLEPLGEVEEILTRSLCLSLIPAICRSVAAKDGTGERTFAFPSDDRAPLLLCLTEKNTPGEAWTGRMTEAFHNLWGEERAVLSVPHPAVFLDIGRRIYRERNLPVAFTRTLAFVSASSLSSVLMPLALGFHVISYPSLPVHGGPKVEAFFSKGVLKRFGGKYIPGREDFSLSAILEELRWTIHAT